MESAAKLDCFILFLQIENEEEIQILDGKKIHASHLVHWLS